MPTTTSTISWGHDYGGAAIADLQHHFPWEDRFKDRDFDEPDPVFNANPYRVPEADQILVEAAQAPPAPTSRPTSPDHISRADCFASMPVEFRMAIAIHLPTADVLNARQASRAFWPLFHSQQFWASRFGAFSERSWLFEIQRSNQQRDWRWLFHRTSEKRIGPGLRNRKRIWTLIQGLLEPLALFCDELPPNLPPLWSPDLRETAQAIEVHADLLGKKGDGNWGPTFDKSCRTPHKQAVAVPDNLARLSVSTVGLGDGTYIAGIALTTTSGETIPLGYHSSSGSTNTLKLCDIRGFHLAVGARGIQALRCITGTTNSVSEWFGCPDDVPKTRRLAVNNRVAVLEAGFDVSANPWNPSAGVLLISFTGMQDDQPCDSRTLAIYYSTSRPRKQTEERGHMVSGDSRPRPVLARTVVSAA